MLVGIQDASTNESFNEEATTYFSNLSARSFVSGPVRCKAYELPSKCSL